MTFWEASAYVLALGLLLIAARIFIKPIKAVSLMLLSSILGGVGLYAFNYVGASLGITIGINIVTAAVCGLLGVPGLTCLAALKLIFGV